jgi:hypothetical protein
MPEPLPFHNKAKPRKLDAVLRPAEPDPLADVEYTGDLEQDAIVELDALEAAFRDRRRQEDRRFKQATDSEFWVAVCFASRQQKEAFLARAGLAEIGDKYLDGVRVAEKLGVDLTEEV